MQVYEVRELINGEMTDLVRVFYKKLDLQEFMDKEANTNITYKVNVMDEADLKLPFGSPATPKTYVYEVYEVTYSWSDYSQDYITITGDVIETFDDEDAALAMVREYNQVANKKEPYDDNLQVRLTYRQKEVD